MQLYLSQHSSGVMDTRGPLQIMSDDPSRSRLRPEGKAIQEKYQQGSGIAELLRGAGQPPPAQIRTISPPGRNSNHFSTFPLPPLPPLSYFE